MFELPNSINDIDTQEAEIDRLVNQGFTYGQAKERVYGQPIEPIQPQSTESTASSELKPRKPKRSMRSGLSWRGRLAADEPPSHIRKQLERQPPELTDQEAAFGVAAAKAIIERLKNIEN